MRMRACPSQAYDPALPTPSRSHSSDSARSHCLTPPSVFPFQICVLLRLADPPPDDRHALADREAPSAGSRRRRRRAAPTHAVVRAADGSEGLCPVRMLRRRQLVVGGRGGDDAYAVRLRQHERAALEPPSAAAIAAAAAMAFGDDRLAPQARAGEDSPVLGETVEGAESVGDDVRAMEEEQAAAAKAAKAEAVEKARQTLRQANLKEQNDAAQSAAAAAKEAAATIASLKSAAGVWPTAQNAESDASSGRERVFSETAGRNPQSSRRRQSPLQTRSRLYAEDAAATINTTAADAEEPQLSGGYSDFEPTTIAGSKSEGLDSGHDTQFKRRIKSPKRQDSGVRYNGRRGKPDDNPISSPRVDQNYSTSNVSCNVTSEDDQSRYGRGPRGAGGDGDGDTEGRVRQAFVELSHQPLGQMFDRRRRGLARSGRPGRESQLESDDSDRFIEQAISVPRWAAAAASAAAGHTSDSDAGSRRSDSRGVGRVDLRAGRREARRAAAAVATASLGHFSPVSGNSRPGSGALAEVASAVMSNGERAEVQGLHVGSAALLPYAPGEGAEGGNGKVSLCNCLLSPYTQYLT